jgi:hypothetical protein
VYYGVILYYTVSTVLERLVRENTNLLPTFVNYGRKKCYSNVTRSVIAVENQANKGARWADCDAEANPVKLFTATIYGFM